MVRVLINALENYAKINNVPIMSKDTIEEIKKIIEYNGIKNVLELGTAIGYSTICFAECNINNITSLERDKSRFIIACKNVKKSKLKNIKLINIDALEYNTNEIFDLIIIDAAKSQNKKFFDKYKNNLSDKGIIIIDNLSFHGLVNNSSSIQSKNLRSMVRKIEEFIKYLNSQNEFDVEYIKVGDELGVCTKK